MKIIRGGNSFQIVDRRGSNKTAKNERPSIYNSGASKASTRFENGVHTLRICASDERGKKLCCSRPFSLRPVNGVFSRPATMASLGLVAAAGFFGHFPSVAKAVHRWEIWLAKDLA
jgi:hypothetical protein